MYINKITPESLRFLDIKIITINDKFNFEDYLYLFESNKIQAIKSYKRRHDQTVAFCSTLLKDYYLASILNTLPSKLCIVQGKFGKPVIGSSAYNSLSFNISHSDEYVVIATINNSDYAIGVDIQKIKYNIEDIEQVSKLAFSKYEQSKINNSSNNFIKMWSKKEALIKSLGCGFLTEDYKNTALDLQPTNYGKDYIIHTFKFEEYYVSICLTEKYKES